MTRLSPFTNRLGRAVPGLLAAALCLFPAVAARAAEGADPQAVRFAGFRPGLEALARGEAARGFDLGGATAVPGEDDARLLSRLRPFAEAGRDNAWRARVEGQYYGIGGRQDRSDLSVYQAFLEGAAPVGGGRVTLRAGRQELVYGSAFLLGADAFYDGQSWDAVRLTVRPPGPVSVDLLAGRYVRRNSGGIEGTLSGIYATVAPAPAVSLDLYALRDTGGVGTTHAGGEHEVTWSTGLRAVAHLGERAEVEAEPVWQSGRKADGAGGHVPIEAFGGHVDLTFRPAPDRFPGRLFAGYAFGTGDKDPASGTFREFHNPNNDTPQVGDMNLVGDLGGLTAAGRSASGLRIATLGGAADISPSLNLSLAAHAVRADRVPDGFSRNLGVEADLVLAWTVREGFVVSLGAERFVTGGFFRDATGSGRDIDTGYLQLQAAL